MVLLNRFPGRLWAVGIAKTKMRAASNILQHGSEVSKLKQDTGKRRACDYVGAVSLIRGVKNVMGRVGFIRTLDRTDTRRERKWKSTDLVRRRGLS